MARAILEICGVKPLIMVRPWAYLFSQDSSYRCIGFATVSIAPWIEMMKIIVYVAAEPAWAKIHSSEDATATKTFPFFTRAA